MIAKFGGFTQDLNLANELQAARAAFEASWNRTLPFAPVNFFVAVGEQPPLVIDFDDLATDRDLFGTHEVPVTTPDASDDDAAPGEPALPPAP